MAAKKGLGRGLGALIQSNDEAEARTAPPSTLAQKKQTESPSRLPIDQIRRNPRQPRHTFDEAALRELADSIRAHGVLQPLIVRKADASRYELIAGERRLRASGLAGLETVPVIITEASDMASLEMALIENVQRENLNPVETAEGYRDLAEQFDLTQEEIAAKTGRSRASVANALRLLSLPDDVLAMLSDQRISTGHAKVLLTIDIEQEQVLLARRVVEDGLSVRALEQIIKKRMAKPQKPRSSRSDLPITYTRELTEKLHTYFGTSVRLIPCKTFANGKKAKGRVEIDFFSNSDLDRVLTQMGLEFDE